MNNTPLIHRIASTSFALAISLVWSATLAAAGIAIPPIPNACAETACPLIRSSAVLACAEENADPDSCETALAELQKCFDQCTDSQ